MIPVGLCTLLYGAIVSLVDLLGTILSISCLLARATTDSEVGLDLLEEEVVGLRRRGQATGRLKMHCVLELALNTEPNDSKLGTSTHQLNKQNNNKP